MTPAAVTNPVEVRRLFMDDHVWERASPSWKDLGPLRDFNCLRDTDESPAQHTERLKPRFDIPHDVIDQWLYRLYYNSHSVNNYGWLDYDRIRFQETTASATSLSTLYIIQPYQSWVQKVGAAVPFGDFMCTPRDKAHWQEHLTWRIPPIVLDVSTITGVPDHAEVVGPLQLVEGHTRLGYLLSMLKAGLITGDSQHRVYRMWHADTTPSTIP